MPEASLQITVKDLQKMLAESILSDELKTAYQEVMADMNDEEQAELIKIIEEGNKAKAEYKDNRLDQLSRLNAALAKHLQNSLRDEEKKIREDLEQFEERENKKEMKNLEEEINNL